MVIPANSPSSSGEKMHALFETNLDPVLSSLLLRDSSFPSPATAGLSVWKRVLLKGRLPEADDFVFGSNSSRPWPPKSFSSVVRGMAQLQLPRFVQRHPETVTAVLLLVLRLAVRLDDDDDDEMMYTTTTAKNHSVTIDTEDTASDNDPETLQLEALTLDEIVAVQLQNEWAGVVHGVQALDTIFGTNHGLLNVQSDKKNKDHGFGLHDGIWQHSGWKTCAALNLQLQQMPKLRRLLQRIGRRPLIQDKIATTPRRFAPQSRDRHGAPAAQLDRSVPSSISGLALSNRFSEMVPSEALLLVRGGDNATRVARRRLFLAKLVESKLLSYESSGGWSNVPSGAVTRGRPWTRRPSAPRGPLVVCLDTSWSMTGGGGFSREALAKAATLACVSIAHEQRRAAHLVAFSTANGVMEMGELSADAAGVSRLLDFLSHAFVGGGTDVTGALRYAMATLGNDGAMAAADLILVTDGEIPPVSEQWLEEVRGVQQRTGMQVHGLLVGKSESKALSMLCSETHNFLNDYDFLSSLSQLAVRQPPPSSPSYSNNSKQFASTARHRTALSLQHLCYSRRRLYVPSYSARVKVGWLSRRIGGRGVMSALHAKNYRFSTEDDERMERRKQGGRNRLLDEDDDDDFDALRDFVRDDETQYVRPPVKRGPMPSVESSFNEMVDKALDELRATVETDISRQTWKPADLDGEKCAEGSCWRYRGEFQAAVERIGEGLVEREVESRLVVLGMAAREHLLMLGPPGTAKSVLGRRLSKLCGGFFFQRLLTRFTTPEEIFGPLSLRALENDEYKRCTAGYLPTASVAFLDEIFKANSAILNTLLTILNERQFDNGAGIRQDCPIRCVVGASNELPESDELDALYDRFLIRKEVRPVSDEGIMRVLSMPIPGLLWSGEGLPTDCDIVFASGLDKVVKDLSKAADDVFMSQDICSLIRDLRNFMRDKLDVDVSDRRLIKAARLLKISAASHGRTSVDPLDCLLLQHVAWRLPEQHSAVRDWLWEHLTPSGKSPSATVARFRLLLDGLRREASVTLRKTSGDVTGASGARRADAAVLQLLQSEVSHIAALVQERSKDLARHQELLRRSMDHLWLDPDEARAAQQLLLPLAEETAREIDRTLVDARMLELALSESSFPNDIRLSVVDLLWEDGLEGLPRFNEAELNMGMKEAKAKFEVDTFRAWKRARKKEKF
jgi:MoxR-like ATPase